MLQYLSNGDHMLSDVELNPIELLPLLEQKLLCENISALGSKILGRIKLVK